MSVEIPGPVTIDVGGIMNLDLSFTVPPHSVKHYKHCWRLQSGLKTFGPLIKLEFNVKRGLKTVESESVKQHRLEWQGKYEDGEGGLLGEEIESQVTDCPHITEV